MFGRRNNTAFLTATLLVLWANYAVGEAPADSDSEYVGDDEAGNEAQIVAEESEDTGDTELDETTGEPEPGGEIGEDETGAEDDLEPIEMSADSDEEMGQPEHHMEGDAAEEHEDDAGMGTLRFTFDSADLNVNTMSQLDELVSWMTGNPDRVVEIRGYTDDVGDEQYNMELGMQRAESAKQYLLTRGVEEQRILIASRGPSEQVAGGSAANRRVLVCTDEDMGDKQMYMEGDGGAEASPATGPIATPGEPGMHPATQPQNVNLAVGIGGGVHGFVDGDTNDFTDTGGSWELGVAYGHRSWVAFEANYVGSVNGIDALGLDSDALLVGTLLEVDVRLNITRTLPFQPYVFGGVGWSHYDVTNADFNTSAVGDSEDAVHVPLGAGIGFRTMGFRFDVRGTLRLTYQDNLIDAPEFGDDLPDLHNLTFGGKLGYEF